VLLGKGSNEGIFGKERYIFPRHFKQFSTKTLAEWSRISSNARKSFLLNRVYKLPRQGLQNPYSLPFIMDTLKQIAVAGSLRRSANIQLF
jgi:hypothetical protein